jgi:hypothetical protein
MSERVLATQAAKQAATAMRSLLGGDLSQRTQEALHALGILASPGVWDGPTATTFRRSLAPQIKSSLTVALRSLQQLQQHSDRVVADIMRAGTSGVLAGAAVAAAAGPPVLDQRTKDMLAYFRQHLNDDGFWGDQGSLESIDAKLAALTPAERAAFLSQLTPAELRDWNQRISGGGGQFWQSEGLTTSDRVQLGNLLLGSADPATLATIEANMPALQPNPHNQEETPNGWSSLSGQPLFGPNGQPVVGDVNQGNEGDCWFLSGLGAVAMQDPSLIEKNIHQNANGTYTVTFYRNGQPVPVTVTGNVPGTSSFGDYAHPGTGDGAAWAQVYEKAYAQLNGGYASIEGGHGNVAMGDITGMPSSRVDLNPALPWDSGPSLSDISSKLDSGYAITSGTSDGKSWPWSSEPNRLDGGWVVPSHEYMVQSVDTSAHPPTITLLNPWGQDGAGPPDPKGSSAPETVTLTEAQWHQYFTDVSLTQTK